jgi:serine phosphatase RsbU (regulator of sigma subunit)
MLYTRRDGTQVWIGGSFSVLRSPKRHIENVVAVLRDISEQKRLEHVAIVEKELEIARNTQSALLPPDFLDHARVKIKCRQEQARLVGGDWYDYWIDGKRLVLVIGDAVGSGMPAALMATLAMSAIRAEAHRSEDILEIIQRVNNSILPNQMEDNFLTIFYSEINLDNLTMRYLNAGHYDPLWVREGRNSRFLPCRERLILGAFDMPDLKVEEIKLKKKDRLILYTDGLIESRNSHRVPFGLNRLVRYVNANSTRQREALINDLYRRLQDFTGKPFDDDITLLVCDIL